MCNFLQSSCRADHESGCNLARRRITPTLRSAFALHISSTRNDVGDAHNDLTQGTNAAGDDGGVLKYSFPNLRRLPRLRNFLKHLSYFQSHDVMTHESSKISSLVPRLFRPQNSPSGKEGLPVQRRCSQEMVLCTLLRYGPRLEERYGNTAKIPWNVDVKVVNIARYLLQLEWYGTQRIPWIGCIKQ